MNTKKTDMLWEIFESLFPSDSIVISGDKILIPMTNDRIAEVNFYSDNIKDQFVGLKVRVIHKTNGLITENVFLFHDYLGDNKNIDGTHPNANLVKKIYVWKDRGNYDWYIVRPKDTKPIANAVLEFVRVYN
jgi:hypothetical protein